MMVEIPEVGKRVADRDIYLGEDRYEAPKEYFKLIHQEMVKDIHSLSILIDVGCASGELLYFLRQKLPENCVLTGVDVVSDLIERAKAKVPRVGFYVADISSDEFPDFGANDLTIMAGVIGALFEPEVVLRNLVGLTRKGGYIYVFGPFNEEPIDVQLVYKKAGAGNDWETGRNVYSVQTMESLVESLGGEAEWVDFFMPFSIPKRDDVMRGWTEDFRGKNYMIYGTNQFTSQKLLKIRLGND